MNVTVSQQTIIFLSCIACGGIIGIIFDLFRIMRRVFKAGEISIFFQDLGYWIIASLAVFIAMLKFNSGEFRWYMFLGVFLGGIMYNLTISSVFIKAIVYILNFLKKILLFILKIILLPVRLVFSIIKKPFIFMFSISKKSFKRAKNNFFGSISVFKKIVTKI